MLSDICFDCSKKDFLAVRSGRKKTPLGLELEMLRVCVQMTRLRDFLLGSLISGSKCVLECETGRIV